jgi:hypothetical protein
LFNLVFVWKTCALFNLMVYLAGVIWCSHFETKLCVLAAFHWWGSEIWQTGILKLRTRSQLGRIALEWKVRAETA